MSLLSLLVVLPLTQAPPCIGERVALLPFESVALTRTAARELEESVRRAAEGMAGVCLEPRAATLERLRPQGAAPAPDCGDTPCQEELFRAWQVDWVVRGVALGVGGVRTVLLTLARSSSAEARTLLQLEEAGAGAAEARVRESFSTLWANRPEREPRALTPPPSPWPRVLLATGALALAAGVGMGLASRHNQALLSEGSGGCAGEGEAFRACFASRLNEGHAQARAANVLMGASALLGASGTLLLVWEVP